MELLWESLVKMVGNLNHLDVLIYHTVQTNLDLFVCWISINVVGGSTRQFSKNSNIKKYENNRTKDNNSNPLCQENQVLLVLKYKTN